MKSFRSKPVGWQRDNYRHYLAAKYGTAGRRYNAETVAGGFLEDYFRKTGAVKESLMAQAKTEGARPYTEMVEQQKKLSRSELTPAEHAEAQERLRELGRRRATSEYWQLLTDEVLQVYKDALDKNIEIVQNDVIEQKKKVDSLTGTYSTLAAEARARGEAQPAKSSELEAAERAYNEKNSTLGAMQRDKSQFNEARTQLKEFNDGTRYPNQVTQRALLNRIYVEAIKMGLIAPSSVAGGSPTIVVTGANLE
jgi:hypothetical protein